MDMRGHAYVDTIRPTRGAAILAYGKEHLHGLFAREIYQRDHKNLGVQVVRCSITTGDA